MCEKGTEVPKLYFFWGTGLGELARLILVYAEVKFDDVRYKYATPEWESIKHKTPLGSLPYYEEGEMQLGGSRSIARYLGEKHSIAACGDRDNALLASYVDAMMDFIPRIFKIVHAKEEDRAGLRGEFFKNEPEKVQIIEQHIKEDLTFLGNGKTTWAEITVCYVCCNLKKYKLDETLQDAPKMRAICDKIDNIPRIKSYREESRVKYVPVY